MPRGAEVGAGKEVEGAGVMFGPRGMVVDVAEVVAGAGEEVEGDWGFTLAQPAGPRARG